MIPHIEYMTVVPTEPDGISIRLLLTTKTYLFLFQGLFGAFVRQPEPKDKFNPLLMVHLKIKPRGHHPREAWLLLADTHPHGRISRLRSHPALNGKLGITAVVITKDSFAHVLGAAVRLPAVLAARLVGRGVYTKRISAHHLSYSPTLPLRVLRDDLLALLSRNPEHPSISNKEGGERAWPRNSLFQRSS